MNTDDNDDDDVNDDGWVNKLNWWVDEYEAKL